MKKIFLIGFISLFCIQVLNAQVKIRPGVRAGLNHSGILNSSLEYKQDFYVGAFAVIKLSKLYNLQPEITYTRQGFRAKGELKDASEGIVSESVKGRLRSFNLDYLSFALKNKFYFTEKSGLHFLIAPSVDFKTNIVPYPKRRDYDKFHESQFNALDIALSGGFGYEFSSGLGIELMYKRGFFDVSRVNIFRHIFTNSSLQTNSVFQLGVSYYFDF